MLTQVIHDCPRCDGSFDMENVAHIDHGDYADWYFLCEFCGHGWLVSLWPPAERFVLEYNQRTEPANYRRFVAELETARAA
jgi:hypothetical protein